MTSLFIFGFGYTANALAALARAQGIDIAGTKRVASDAPPIFAFDGVARLSDAGEQALQNADAVLITIPPDDQGDKVFRLYGDALMAKKNLRWLGYLSTTGVYDVTDGSWVDEHTPTYPQTESGKNRLLAEQQFLAAIPQTHIFRLSGIYGPQNEGRSPIDRAKNNAPIIDAPGHVFNRIHADDIARILLASINHPRPGEIYNVSDNLPASGAEIMQAAYQAIGKIPPTPVALKDADLSPMGREFYRGCKRVKNDKVKNALNITLKYPTWREGLS